MIFSGMAYLNIINTDDSCLFLALCSAYHTVETNQSVSLSAQLHFDED